MKNNFFSRITVLTISIVAIIFLLASFFFVNNVTIQLILLNICLCLLIVSIFIMIKKQREKSKKLIDEYLESISLSELVDLPLTSFNNRFQTWIGRNKKRVLRWYLYRGLLITTTIAILVSWNRSENFSWAELSANAFTEVLGILLTVLIIDTLNEQRSNKEKNDELAREMGSSENTETLKAVRELRARGWLQNGSLRGSGLYRANLQNSNLEYANMSMSDLMESNLENANLSFSRLVKTNLCNTKLGNSILTKANLMEADLSFADLTNAQLTLSNLEKADLTNAKLHGADLFGCNLYKTKGLSTQLVKVKSLCFAKMPNGKRYDGRFRLSWDIGMVLASKGLDSEDIAMADKLVESDFVDYYKISLDDYRKGQEWADNNLQKFQSEADQEEKSFMASFRISLY